MGLQWDILVIWQQKKVKYTAKCVTQKVGNRKISKHGAKAVSWDQDYKPDSNLACYAPVTKFHQAKQSAKAPERIYSVVLRRRRVEFEVWTKAGTYFVLVVVQRLVVFWRRHSTVGIAVQSLGMREMIPHSGSKRF